MSAPWNIAAPAMTKIGMAPWRRAILTALVRCPAPYISALKAVKPRAPRARIDRHRALSSAPWLRTVRPAKTARMARTRAHRPAVSSMGEISPTAARLTTALPPQLRVVTTRSR